MLCRSVSQTDSEPRRGLLRNAPGRLIFPQSKFEGWAYSPKLAPLSGDLRELLKTGQDVA